MPNTPTRQAKGEASRKFIAAMKGILSVPKAELQQRERRIPGRPEGKAETCSQASLSYWPIASLTVRINMCVSAK